MIFLKEEFGICANLKISPREKIREECRASWRNELCKWRTVLLLLGSSPTLARDCNRFGPTLYLRAPFLFFEVTRILELDLTFSVSLVDQPRSSHSPRSSGIYQCKPSIQPWKGDALVLFPTHLIFLCFGRTTQWALNKKYDVRRKTIQTRTLSSIVNAQQYCLHEKERESNWLKNETRRKSNLCCKAPESAKTEASLR